MVVPLHAKEQIRQSKFVADNLLAVFFGMSKFDAVQKQTKAGLKSYFIDIEEA